jgi:hypothetical protein
MPDLAPHGYPIEYGLPLVEPHKIMVTTYVKITSCNIGLHFLNKI